VVELNEVDHGLMIAHSKSEWLS